MAMGTMGNILVKVRELLSIIEEDYESLERFRIAVKEGKQLSEDDRKLIAEKLNVPKHIEIVDRCLLNLMQFIATCVAADDITHKYTKLEYLSHMNESLDGFTRRVKVHLPSTWEEVYGVQMKRHRMESGAPEEDELGPEDI